jgi:hypothetical protein
MMNARNYRLVAILARVLTMLNVVPAFTAARLIWGTRLLQPVPERVSDGR